MIEKEKSEVVLFAETEYRNIRKKFGIKTNDRRRHMYLIGKTGTGKSTTIKNMIYQDIQAGRGVAVLDSQGDLAEKVINFIPSFRVNDAIYFNPADKEYPFSFNVLENVDASYRHFLVVSNLIAVFKKIWADSWSPRLEYVLRNIILALLEYPGSTLLGIGRILTDKEFRQKVIDRVTDSVVRSFWIDEYPRYPEHLQTEVIAPIQDKVGQFFSTSLIRNIVGQVNSKIDISEVVDKGKILVMNLSKARIGENASALLGAMMITKIQMAAMSRINIPENQRHDFYLYIDEFQDFATDSFADVISKENEYRLNLIIAHQYIGQLMVGQSLRIRDAVFSNIGTMIVYRVGVEDAKFLVKKFFPRLGKTDLVGLDKHNVYVKLMIDGVISGPFSASILTPRLKLEGNKDKIIRISRERYTEPKRVIEEKIARWSGVIKEGESLPQLRADRYESHCNNCGVKVYVPFIPDGIRPVYCKECLKKSRESAQQLLAKRL